MSQTVTLYEAQLINTRFRKLASPFIR